MPGDLVLTTDRLVLRRFTREDDAFILELLNEPGWLRWIGDRNVHSLEDARGYLERGPLKLYADLGFGFYRVELASDGSPIGMCGLIQRAGLDDVDIGFSLLARCHGHGYAFEAAARVVRHAREDLGLVRLVAIVVAANERSVRLLKKLGMRYERVVRLPKDPEELHLYGMALVAP